MRTSHAGHAGHVLEAWHFVQHYKGPLAAQQNGESAADWARDAFWAPLRCAAGAYPAQDVLQGAALTVHM